VVEDQVIWHALPADLLLWEDWGDSYAVFCRVTGETHFLNDLPGEVLRRLGDGPQGVRDLAISLAVDCETEYSEAWRRKIAGIISDLASLELVEAIR
jgi:PqqD family protein of HPr-rel-A system